MSLSLSLSLSLLSEATKKGTYTRYLVSKGVTPALGSRFPVGSMGGAR